MAVSMIPANVAVLGSSLAFNQVDLFPVWGAVSSMAVAVSFFVVVAFVMIFRRLLVPNLLAVQPIV